jgi:Icc-related predicted phosphoesterase
MKILHVSDFHHHRPWFTWVAKQAKAFDWVCLTGDLLDSSEDAYVASTPLEDQIDWILTWLRRFPGRLMVTSGNHDCWPTNMRTGYSHAEAQWLQEARRENVMVDGDSADVGGYRVTCVGWMRPVLPDYFGLSVMLWHAPPQALKVSTARNGEDFGDFRATLVAEQLAPGSMILSGHVHEPLSWRDRIGEVICLNPGRGPSTAPFPNHVVIDATKGRAMLQSSRGTDGPVRL